MSGHRAFSLRRPPHVPRESGFTLIELLVALLLGTVVMAGVISVFTTNQKVYRSNKAVSDVQDSARMAFEMMARDLRVAGLTGCGNGTRIANVVNNSASQWYTNWTTPIIGYAASQTDPAAASRAANTDSLILLGVEGVGVSVKANAEPAATFTINESSSNLNTGDIVMVCDPDHGAIVQLSNVNGTTLTHATAGTPGNCTLDLSYPTVCSSGSSYVFAANAQIARMTAADWHVAANPATGGTSLYRLSLGLSSDGTGKAATTRYEMVRDVTGMTLRYHQASGAAFVAANAVTDWSQVDAVQVTLSMISTDRRAGINNAAVSRTFTSTITLRNRVT
ncbi:PilW family protein [Dyella japonica]|uniref:Pilus assembly protein PilW n=1 Tax=Dyella japonica A8 TaxID=1217721 RepID=A0A075K3X3_9GAMM|nr:prepilin-type N-terminal cleavage/methylation domain-containing protein [Dyella japonica]AIF48889.1 hypothetical protein HY57_17390 [Dyella japonica A8]